jgi:tetratricopeptide (TPR) repeat protein
LICGFGLWPFFHKKGSEQTPSYSNDAIIEQALNLELQTPSTTFSDEEKKIGEEIMDRVRKADYAAALLHTVQGVEKYPQSFSLQSDLASLLGDYSEITAEPLKSKMVQRARTIFDTLLQEADAQPKEVYFPFKNEYYFRFGMYLEQYNTGVERVAYFWGTDQWIPTGAKGYYCQGVGAAHYAKQLLIQGQKDLAREYAQKAIIAWAQCFSYKNDYYNSYVHYALALGILGQKEEMMRALEHSASLIRRDLDYHEFKEVIEFIEQTFKRA